MKQNLKHTMWNVGKACKSAIPVFLTAAVMLFLKEVHEDKAIQQGANIAWEDVMEKAKENSDIEVTEF